MSEYVYVCVREYMTSKGYSAIRIVNFKKYLTIFQQIFEEIIIIKKKS